MKPVPTTITLAVFALLSLITSISVHYLTLPGADAKSELIGKVFYPDFTQPDQAASLELAIWDDEDKKTKNFEIKKVDDLWTIPSYNDYPVESADQLIATAGSVINIKREFSAGRGSDTHARFGVIDPNDEEAKLKEPNQIGDRIILKDESGNVVCDLIIGNPVDPSSTNEGAADGQIVKGNRYYVRQPDQDETFAAELNLQISTDFEDWIETDLLQVEDAAVKQLLVRTYDIENKPIELTGGEPFPMQANLSDLILEKDGFDWKLNDLNEETETLDTAPISSLSNDLKALKIIHVEPKPVFQDTDTPVLNGDLTANLPKGLNNRSEMRVTQESWSVITPYGFFPSFADGKTKESLTVLSANGEFDFSTDAGLVYHMKFGGDVKLEKDKFEFVAGKTDAKKEDAGSDADPDSNKSEDETDNEPNMKKGKIMSVHVTFDESLIEKPTLPVKPIEPTKPVKKGEPEATPADKDGQPKASQPPKSIAPTELKNEEAQPKQDPAKPAEKTDEAEPAKGNEESGSCRSFEQEESESQEEAKSQEESKAVEKQEEPKKETEKQKPKKETLSDEKPANEKPATKNAEVKEEAKIQEGTDPAKTAATKSDPINPKNNQQKPAEEKPDEFELAMQKYNTEMQKYQTDLAAYQDQMQQYKSDLEAYEKKVSDSKQKAENLNSRFSNWFYVVDSANLSKLKLVRADIVKPKEKTDAPTNAGDLKLPGAGELPPGLKNPNLNQPPSETDSPEPAKSTEPPRSDPEKKPAGESKKETAAKSDQPKKPDQPQKTDEPQKTGEAKPKEATKSEGSEKKDLTPPKPVPPGPEIKKPADPPAKSADDKAAGTSDSKKTDSKKD